MKKIRVGSVFSGAGAFEYALKKANIDYETIFACDNGEIVLDIDYEYHYDMILKLNNVYEIKKYSDNLYSSLTKKKNYMKHIYLENHSVKDEMFFYDVKLLDGSYFEKKIDLLVGGSPCQAFSTVGKRHGFNDTRGTLFHEYARILKETKPKYFIYENVKGLFTHDKGRTWEVVKATFDELGYHFKYEILNSKNYGLPQNRNRIFVIGFKNISDFNKFKFPKPKKLKWKMHDFLESNVDINNFRNLNGHIEILKRKKQKNVLNRYFLTPGVEKYVMSSGTKSWYQEPKIDLDIARPLLKTMGNHHRAGTDNYVNEFGKIRMLTEREAFRLQGFGDDFLINVSPAQGYKIAGNSIPTTILFLIFKNLFK